MYSKVYNCNLYILHYIEGLSGLYSSPDVALQSNLQSKIPIAFVGDAAHTVLKF